MSKRYGRKQKRAHRAQIADQQVALMRQESRHLDYVHATDTMRRKFAHLVEAVQIRDEEMRGILGRHTALAVVPETMALGPNERLDRMPIYQPMSVAAFSADMSTESMTYHVAEMVHLVAGLDDNDLEQLRKFIFLKVEREGYREAEVRHTLSREYWDQMKWTGQDGRHALQRLVRHILPDLTAMLTREPAKRKVA